MSQAIGGILYAEDFDELHLPPVQEPEPEPPSFTIGDLDAVRSTAGADAVTHARAEWDASALQARTHALAAIAAAVSAARHDAQILSEQVAEGTARTILAMLAALLPALCARHGGAEARALLRQLLPTLKQQPRIAIRVASSTLDGIRDDLALLDEDLLAAIVLSPAALAPGDARVTWTDGALVRDEAAIQAAIGVALAELGLLHPSPIPNRSTAIAE